MSLNEWDEATAEEISVADVDAAIEAYDRADKEYKEAKKIADAASAEKQEAASKVLDILERSKKSKYVVDGIGTAFVINKLSVQTPKTITEKQKLFDYVKDKYGYETFMGFAQFNSASLNSFYNAEAELAAKDGVANFELPGVGSPKSYQSLGFRRK